MKVQSYLPCPSLSPYIKGYMVIESIEGMKNLILPEPAMVMAFRIKGTISDIKDEIKEELPLSVISGIRRSTRHLEYDKNTAAVLVKFCDGGATAFFKEPLYELRVNSLSLDNFIKQSKQGEIEDKLATAGNHLQYIAIIEKFLINQLKERQQDLLILNSAQKIKLYKGNIAIHSLMENIPLSRDAFEKRFRKTIGTSPKQYANIIRFRNFIEAYPFSQNLTEAGYEFGYFDQSHLIKDFRSFTGQAPHEFFKSSRWW